MGCRDVGVRGNVGRGDLGVGGRESSDRESRVTESDRESRVTERVTKSSNTQTLTLHKENLVIIRNVHQLAEIALGLA